MTQLVAVVTGGGRGIGRAIAQRFATDGWQVVVAARSAGELEETRQAIERAKGQCEVVTADVCVTPDIDALVELTVNRFGRLDLLVNNAGMAPNTTIEALEPSLFETLMSVNCEAVYYACRAVWPVMRNQGGGIIINISSIASAESYPGFVAYGAAKAWVNAWTRGLAEEGRPLGIRVFAVAPGAVETRMLRDTFPEFPHGQALDAGDVADLAFLLTHPGCRYSSGQTIFIRK